MTELLETLQGPVFTGFDANFSIWTNTLITLYMTVLTMLFTTLIGVPLGVLLFETTGSRSLRVRRLHDVLGFIVNVGRSFPFIILIIALLPVTRLVVGSVTGPNAAVFALTVSAIPFLARLVEINLREIPAGKIEAVRMMGATRGQVIRQVLLPEALPGLIGSLTTTAIAVIGYTAMAGAVGGQGLGDLAIRMGYNSYDTVVMTATVLVLVLIVITIQAIGSRCARAVDHRARNT